MNTYNSLTFGANPIQADPKPRTKFSLLSGNETFRAPEGGYLEQEQPGAPVMGSGPSRGKRVAPECVREVKVTKTGAAVSPSKPDRGPFHRLHIHTVVRNTRSRLDRERQDADLSEVDTVLADGEDPGRESEKRSPPKRTFVWSKTYGLCHFGEDDAEEEVSSAAAPRASEDVNKRKRDAFTHTQQHTPDGFTQHHSSSKKFLARGTLLENAPTSEKQPTSDSCHTSPVTTPLILYDGSEEELMDTIEREFS